MAAEVLAVSGDSSGDPWGVLRLGVHLGFPWHGAVYIRNPTTRRRPRCAVLALHTQELRRQVGNTNMIMIVYPFTVRCGLKTIMTL
jgi:hypothetical protein